MEERRRIYSNTKRRFRVSSMRQTNTHSPSTAECMRDYQEVLLFTKYQLSYLGNKLCMTPWRRRRKEARRLGMPEIKSRTNGERKLTYSFIFGCLFGRRIMLGMAREFERTFPAWVNERLLAAEPALDEHVATFYARNLCVTFFFSHALVKEKRKNFIASRETINNINVFQMQDNIHKPLRMADNWIKASEWFIMWVHL